MGIMSLERHVFVDQNTLEGEEMRPEEEFVELIIPLDVRYKWSAGPHLQAFLLALKEGKIIGNQCPRCGHALIPPIPVCARCHVEMGGFIEFPPRGKVITYSFVVDPIFDSGTGDWRPTPYVIASIHVDGGTDATFFHKLEETDPKKVNMGMRVEAVFRPKSERKGSIEDVQFLRTI